MYSVWQRLYAVGVFALYALGGLAVMCGVVTSHIVPEASLTRLEAHRIDWVQPVRVHWHRRSQVSGARFSLDVDADLRGVWNWNVKSVFVFVTASHGTNGTSEVTVWDRVLESPEDSRVVLEGEPIEYPLIDTRSALRGRDLHLTLHWDVMPMTGLLKLGRSRGGALRLPARDCKGAACAA